MTSATGSRFDVLVERVEGDQLVTDSVLTVEDFADQLAGVPVMFGHVTPSSLKRLGMSLNTLLGDGWIDYRPTLDIGAGTLVADGTVALPVPGGATDIFGGEQSPRGRVRWTVRRPRNGCEVTVTPPGAEHGGRPPHRVRSPACGRPPCRDPHGRVGRTDLARRSRWLWRCRLPAHARRQGIRHRHGPDQRLSPVLTASDDGLGMLSLAYHHLRDAVGAEDRPR